MDTCVFCCSTTNDYDSVLCVYCLDYINNIAQIEGEHCEDDELEKYGHEVDDIFFSVRRGRSYMA